MKTKKRKIKALATTVIGPLHEARRMPCQDYCCYNTGGRNFVAIVSDGAGSAKFGKVGARIVCETLNDHLSNTGFDKIKETVVHAINIAREKLKRHRLNKTKDEEGINNFAATVVGAVYYQNKGLFFHIGDGAALAFKENNLDGFIASKPENGLFSCETYFYTMSDWKENLRFTSFEDVDAIFLMSDGVTNFAFSNDFNKIEKGFIQPIHDYLCNESLKSRAVRALNNTLNTPAAKKLNNDDKTIFWAKL